MGVSSAHVVQENRLVTLCVSIRQLYALMTLGNVARHTEHFRTVGPMHHLRGTALSGRIGA